MKSYAELSLGRESLDFIRGRLSLGRTLSRSILAACDLSLGSVVTYLPAGTPGADEFTTGGKLPAPDSSAWVSLPDGGVAVPIPSNLDLIPRKVHEYLQAGPNRVWVFEDFNASPSDPVLKEISARYVSLDDEVYYPLDHRNSEEAIREAADSAYSFVSFVGAGARLSPSAAERLSRVNEIQEDDLLKIASGMDLLTVGAYDGESFLLWRKS